MRNKQLVVIAGACLLFITIPIGALGVANANSGADVRDASTGQVVAPAGANRDCLFHANTNGSYGKG